MSFSKVAVARILAGHLSAGGDRPCVMLRGEGVGVCLLWCPPLPLNCLYLDPHFFPCFCPSKSLPHPFSKGVSKLPAGVKPPQ